MKGKQPSVVQPLQSSVTKGLPRIEMKPFTVFPATLISISYFNIAVKDRHTAISNAFTSVNVLETSTRRFCVVSFTRESETLVLATLEMIAHLVRSVKKPFFRSFRRSFEATKTVSASFFRVKPSSLRRPRVYHTSSDLSRTRHFVHSIETGSDRVVSFTLSSETVVLATSKSIALCPILVKPCQMPYLNVTIPHWQGIRCHGVANSLLDEFLEYSLQVLRFG